MSDLKPLTALGRASVQCDQIGLLRIAENANVALASLAARKGQGTAVAAAISAALNLDLPSPGKRSHNASHQIFWLGPDQWMVAAAFDRHELLADEVKAAVGATASVTEQTDGWCCFEVSAHCAEDTARAEATLFGLFERLCAVDVRQMGPQDACRTSIHHTGCFLIRTDDGFAVIGPRSSAGSLHHALLDVAGGL